MRVCVYSSSTVCGVYQAVMVYDGVSLFQNKNVLFFCLFCLVFFVTTSIASAWSGLGAGLLYNRCMSRDSPERLGLSRSSQMNLCKWLFDSEASLICQLCLFKQTLPCRATQSLESADSTGEIKTKCFQLKWQDSSLTSIFGVECIIELASQASCFSDSVVWSVVLYGFVCAVFFAFSEVKTAHFWAMFLYQVVSPQYCYYSVTMVYYITFKYSYWMLFFFSCRNIVRQQCNCALGKKKILACKKKQKTKKWIGPCSLSGEWPRVMWPQGSQRSEPSGTFLLTCLHVTGVSLHLRGAWSNQKGCRWHRVN